MKCKTELSSLIFTSHNQNSLQCIILAVSQAKFNASFEKNALINTNGRNSLLCEHKWDKMTNMHCLRRRPSACIKVKGLLIFISIKYLVHISREKAEKTWCNSLVRHIHSKKLIFKIWVLSKPKVFINTCMLSVLEIKKVLIYSFFNLRKALSSSVSMGKNTSKKNVIKNENLVLKLCNF